MNKRKKIDSHKEDDYLERINKKLDIITDEEFEQLFTDCELEYERIDKDKER